ncbi:MAG: hypothetical protein JSV04_08325 [Candidatus Heimdallarchaeota archaeon]|nr:MAG: hypothetical protein JSV04_08325 [Candidatus Heimdallarchaeota archaeon]
MDLFRQDQAIEIQFEVSTRDDAFCWLILVLDEIDRYYLPLVKKPIVALKIGMAKITYP